MIEPGLVEALNDSINRLARGASVSDCLRRYPQHAAELERLLEMGQLVRRSQSSIEEAQQARERGQLQFDRALMEPMPGASPVPLQRLAQLAATLVLVLMIFASGAGLLAENSLPGDTLYGVKLITEQARLSLNPGLQTAFEQRRIDEAHQIVGLRREAELTFSGVIDSVQASQIDIAGLTVDTSPLPEREPLVPGQRVEVRAVSDARGRLTARAIRLLEPSPQTDVMSATEAPAATPHPTRQPTREPERPAQSPTVSDRTVDITPSTEASGCTVSPPDGWVAYTVQAGDNLSTLAASSGGSLDEVAAVNCVRDTRIIVAGQRIYLPAQPVRPTDRPTITEEPLRPTATEPPTQGRDAGGQRDRDEGRPQQRREPTEESQRDGESSDGGRGR